MGSELITNTTDANFTGDVLNSDVPVLVDFWATWCGPCKAIAPVLDKMAGDYEGKLSICKVDVDHNQAIAGQFGVRNIPTLLLFKGGEVVGQRVGALNRKALDEFVSTAL
jgi:thioredoxin 1